MTGAMLASFLAGICTFLVFVTAPPIKCGLIFAAYLLNAVAAMSISDIRMCRAFEDLEKRCREARNQ